MIAQDKAVRSQLIPIETGYLLLPNTCIAEVITYTEPTKSDEMPEWLLGMIHWRGLTIPLISFEAANGMAAPQTNQKARIIVLNSIGGDSNLPFYGLFSQGIPRLLNVEKNDITEADSSDTALPLMLEQVKIADQEPIIPNLDEIEKMLIDLKLTA